MNKLVRTLQSYLVFSLPFVLACMVWSSTSPEQNMPQVSLFYKAAWEALSWNLMAWFAALALFLTLLAVIPAARENTLKRLANLKERDEREQYITGKASRAAYIANLSILILFLFFSIFSVDIYRVPASDAVNGKTGAVTIGAQFSLLEKKDTAEAETSKQVILETKELALSKSALMLFLIIWQLAVFNYTARKEHLGGDED